MHISKREKQTKNVTNRLRAQQSNMQPDLRMPICEHIIRVYNMRKMLTRNSTSASNMTLWNLREKPKEGFVPLKKFNCLNSENNRAITNFAC
ncbi:hypothetical protein TNCV_3340391 [Trichonephila clavipes]|nr:hypothetical protein TNCV_3340391 [Trichonephila clavipes]